MSFSVGEAAAMSGVTVRLLHHYDDVGLLCPSARSDAGYRKYDEEDVARLRRALTYRELGFALDEIAVILDDPRAGAGTHLRRQHHLLTERIHRLQKMVAAVERALGGDGALVATALSPAVLISREAVTGPFRGSKPRTSCSWLLAVPPSQFGWC